MIRSMTGFGAAAGVVGPLRVSVELRTVNHRFFNPNLKLPAAFTRWEGEVRELLRQRIARGHVTAVVRIDRDAASSGGLLAVDEERFAAFVAQLRSLQQKYALDGALDIATVLRMPQVIAAGSADEEIGVEGSAAELLAVVEGALVSLMRMREEEGKRLAAFLLERVEIVEGALARVASRAPVRLLAQRDRLRAAVRDLLDGMAADETRLAQEIAILADRLDVSEELDRFRSHIAAFRGALVAGGTSKGDAVGKRLGFLLQEMLREANTTGSKANDADMLRDVVLVKEELERIREQVENLE